MRHKRAGLLRDLYMRTTGLDTGPMAMITTSFSYWQTEAMASQQIPVVCDRDCTSWQLGPALADSLLARTLQRGCDNTAAAPD